MFKAYNLQSPEQTLNYNSFFIKVQINHNLQSTITKSSIYKAKASFSKEFVSIVFEWMP